MSDQTDTPEQQQRKALKAVHVHYVQQQLMLLNALKAELGSEVRSIVEKTSSHEFCQTFEKLAQQTGKNSIDDLIQFLWEPLRSQGYEFSIEKLPEGVQIHCTACPYATLYRALGGSEWGYTLYCSADAALTQAFNPGIGFKRTQTLMEGHACCDHFYYEQKG